MTQVTILGAGMAGFGAAHRLHHEAVESVIFEQHPYHGGHTASHRYGQGFLFDEGPHVSFTKVERIQELFAASVQQRYQTLTTRVDNHWKGHWIKHPVQCNLYGLPTDLVVEILKDFIQAQQSEPGEIRNYADWLIASFGRTFAETFPMEYGLKYHTTTADNMTTEWVGPRLYQANLEEVLRGALTPSTPDVHYISHFRYPTHGGFVSYLDPFLEQTTLRLAHRVTRIDPVEKMLRFANGSESRYEHLVSSLPLPELVRVLADAPAEVVAAAERLACTEAVIVNLGIGRPEVHDAHWSYFYDRDFFFTRMSTPHLQSPNNVPPGCSSLQVECYYSKKYRPLDRRPEDCIEPVLRDLRRCGLLHEDDEILLAEAMHVPYANVIFDLDRPEALATVHGYLDELGIAYCGRYGEWGYIWTDQAFMSGENAAQKVLDRLTSGSVA